MNWGNISVYEKDPDGVLTGNVARFVIPQASLQARLATEVRQHSDGRVQNILSRQVHGISATRPLGAGTTVVWQNDERDARGGRPLAVVDNTPGKMPMVMLTGGIYPYQQALEQLAEARHYEESTQAHWSYWDKVMPQNMLTHDRNRWVEKQTHYRNHRRVFAFTKRWMPPGKDWI